MKRPVEKRQTSVDPKNITARRRDLGAALRYLGVSAFVALFGVIYEHFSFGVFSPYMAYAFLIPLVCGVAVFLISAELSFDCASVSRWLWHSGTATLTVGSLFRGVLEIYGTSSELEPVYFIAGAAFLALGAISATVTVKKPR